jgi:hypothetical protein
MAAASRMIAWVRVIFWPVALASYSTVKVCSTAEISSTTTQTTAMR